MTSYMRDRTRGLPPGEAAASAVDRFMNYDIRAPWVNALRGSVLPFLSYTYAFVPVWLRFMAQKPWKTAKILTIGYVLQALAYEFTEGDEEEERRVMSGPRHGVHVGRGCPRCSARPSSQETILFTWA